MNQNQTAKPSQSANELRTLALDLGASQAALINPAWIPVDDDLADLCRQPRCANYGSAASCPPHVGGPEAMRRILARADQALVFTIELPAEILNSSQRPEIGRLLHELGAGLERQAAATGFDQAKAFVGGSCKRIFCADKPDCNVVDRGGACRNPDGARPSMSGYGINVNEMCRRAGLVLDQTGTEKMAWVVGLVILAKADR